MKVDPTDAAADGEHARLLRQRNLALVCAILAGALTLGMVWTNYGKEYPGLGEMREAVRQHQRLLAENSDLEATVSSVLAANRQELERVQRASRQSP